MLASGDQSLVNDIHKTLLDTANGRIRKVILYGSRATGNAREDSDFDVLVIEQEPVSKREESLRLRRALEDFPYSVDVWVMGEEEFEETKDVIGGLAYPAKKYGVVLS